MLRRLFVIQKKCSNRVCDILTCCLFTVVSQLRNVYVKRCTALKIVWSKFGFFFTVFYALAVGVKCIKQLVEDFASRIAKILTN